MTPAAKQRRAERHAKQKAGQQDKFIKWFFQWTGVTLDRDNIPDTETRCQLFRAEQKTIRDEFRTPKQYSTPNLSFLNGKQRPCVARKGWSGLQAEQAEALADNARWIPPPPPGGLKEIPADEAII